MPITTSTPRNPKNEGAYNLESLPATDGRSRFARPENFEGHRVQPAGAVAAAYIELAQERLRQAPEASPPKKTVRLWYVGQTESGEWVKVPRGQVERTPDLKVASSQRFGKLKSQGGQLLDEVFLGETDARDDALYAALLELCEQIKPASRELRAINDALAILLLARAGISIRADELPNIGTEHR
jgi:hypothetical protein